MENNRKGNGILFVFLILLVLGMAGYLVYDKVLSKDMLNDNENVSKEESKNEENLILEESFDYYFNNAMHKITYRYLYNSCNEQSCEDIEMKYYITLNVLLDNKKLDKELNVIYGKLFENDYNKLKNMIIYGYDLYNDSYSQNSTYPLGRNNINLLESDTEEYIVININESGEFVPKGETLLIVDDGGTIIKDVLLEGSRSFYFDNEYNYSKISDNDDVTYSSFLDNKRFYIFNKNLYYVNIDCPEVNISKNSIVDGKVVESKIDLNKDYIVVEGEDCY